MDLEFTNPIALVAYCGAKSGDHRNAHAWPVCKWKLAGLPDHIECRQQFLKALDRARSESRRHHELRFRVRTLDHPRDPPALGASAGTIHIERAECVATGREQLEVVGRELKYSGVGRHPGRLATGQPDPIRSGIERPEIHLGRPRACNLNRAVEVAERQCRLGKRRHVQRTD